MDIQSVFFRYIDECYGSKAAQETESRWAKLREDYGLENYWALSVEDMDDWIKTIKNSELDIANNRSYSWVLVKYKEFMIARNLYDHFIKEKERGKVVKLGEVDGGIRSLVTAIRTKPFVLLAGISGTGKSRIVRELARSCWDVNSEERRAQMPENFEMIQVKPNWHDSSELIGYVSRVNGEKFIVGDFLRFVARAWKHLDMPYFLCLDEMNLAPVEQYFAEYLSVVESRKVRDGKIVTDAIVKKPSDRVYEVGKIYKDNWYLHLIQDLFGDDTELMNRMMDEGLSLPQNLVVIGTVNMDETTFSFSRKVLDRAMTIEMNEVDLHGGLEAEGEERLYVVDPSQVIGCEVEGRDVYGENRELCDRVLDYLGGVNEVLERTPFKIAYRTRNEFLVYVVNGMRMRGEMDEEECLARCLDEMTGMKILSRIEGEQNQVKGLLEHLKGVIGDRLNGMVEGVKFGSLAKLDEMLEKLSYVGYTSFWK